MFGEAKTSESGPSRRFVAKQLPKQRSLVDL
jgi:hypothetical protein